MWTYKLPENLNKMHTGVFKERLWGSFEKRRSVESATLYSYSQEVLESYIIAPFVVSGYMLRLIFGTKYPVFNIFVTQVTMAGLNKLGS